MPKGGLPDDAARLQLVRLVEVRLAIKLLNSDYEVLTRAHRYDELSNLLIERAQDLVAHGDPYGYKKTESST